MSTDLFPIPRAVADPEEPWTAPLVCTPVRLRRSTDGAEPRLATRVFAWYDAEALSILFSLSDDRVAASMTRRDAPLWEEDVVEVFLAPESLERYFEVEVSPLATIFDARIDSPQGERASMHVDRSWDCSGLLPMIRRIDHPGGIELSIVFRLPFASLGRSMPAAGEEWRGNFYRIDRNPALGDEFSAWQPTLRNPPDFHVPARFGTLRFTG